MDHDRGGDLSPFLRSFVIDNIQTGSQIGNGSNGRILEAKWEGITVAVKEIHSIFNGVSDVEFHSLKRKFLHECEQAGRMRHPNVVRFLGIYHPSGARLPSLVMERLHCSLDCLISEHPVIPIRTKLSVIKDVALGLRYLHTRNPPIIHRDLSSNNVLISKGMEGKIGDLGTARFLDPKKQSQMTKAPGTVDFMPPEALEDVTDIHYGRELDVFSFGCVMLHTLSHEWPTPSQAVIINPDTGLATGGRTEVERRSKYFESIDKSKSDLLIPLIERCLSNLAKNRPSIIRVCNQLDNQVIDNNCTSIDQSIVAALQQEIQEKNAKLHSNHRELQGKDSEIRKKNVQIQQLIVLLQNKEAMLETLRRDISKVQITPSRLPQNQVNKSSHVFWSKLKLIWQQCTDLPCNCWAISVAEIDGKVFAAMLGSNSGYANPFMYNSDKNEWRSVTSLPCTRFCLVTIPERKHLLAIGGTINNKGREEITNKVFLWDEMIKKWTTPYPKMPTARYRCSSITYGLSVIVAGGITSLNPHNLTRAVEVLCIANPPTHSYWSTVEQLPFAVYDAIPLIVNGKLYLAQGYNTYGDQSSRNVFTASIPELYQRNKKDTSVHQVWKKMPDMPYSSCSINHYQGRLITFSGNHKIEPQDGNKAIYESVPLIHIYNPCTNTWDCVGNIPHGYLLGRSVHLAQNKIMFIGGVTGTEHFINDDFMMTTCSTLTLL